MNPISRVKLSWFTGLLFSCLIGHLGVAQQSPISDEQRRFLDVRRRQVELKSARTQLKRTQDLLGQGLVSRTDLDHAQTAVETAQLNYQEAVLSLLSLQPRLSVRQAVKYQTKDGRQFVRLTVENLTPTFDDAQFRLLSNFDGADPIPEALRRRDIQDIFVSLKAAGQPGTGPDAAEFVATLGELRQRGKAILMSTHDIFRAKEIADRAGIMKEGRKVMERTQAELEQEDLEQLYLDYMRGSPGLEGEAEKRHRAS